MREDGWQPIATAKGKFGESHQSVLGYGKIGFSPRNTIEIMDWHRWDGFWFVRGELFHPTHWQPLPAAPHPISSSSESLEGGES